MNIEERAKKIYDDNWPEGSLEEFIWERCEMNNQSVRKIMARVEAEILWARINENDKFCGEKYNYRCGLDATRNIQELTSQLKELEK